MSKSDDVMEAIGAVDEAQSSIGLARAVGDVDLDEVLVHTQRDLYVLMAEVAAAPDSRDKLEDGTSRVSSEMLLQLEERIDELGDHFDMPTDFVIPGENELAARLDVARAVVRRAERAAVRVAVDGSLVVPYLNRLSSLMWSLARWKEVSSLPARQKED